MEKRIICVSCRFKLRLNFLTNCDKKLDLYGFIILKKFNFILTKEQSLRDILLHLVAGCSDSYCDVYNKKRITCL